MIPMTSERDRVDDRQHDASRSGPEGRPSGFSTTEARRSRPDRRDRSRVLTTLLLLVVAACAGPGLGSGTPEYGEWRELELGWPKLDCINNWLVAEGAWAPSDERLEATLELAEARVQLTRLDGTTIDDRTRMTRLELAGVGFEDVIEDPLVSDHQKRRAEEGLALVEGMGFASAKPATRRTRTASSSVDGVVPRAAWRARPVGTNINRATGGWNRITIHHTAMDARHLYRASASSSAAELRLIQRQHQDANGWADIGYHFLIDPSGRVFEGRSLHWQGAHAGRDSATGRNFNEQNIGICLLGNFQTERPTPAALDSLEDLIATLSRQNGIARSSIYGHQHFKGTECPGRHLASWLTNYKRGIASVAPHSDHSHGLATSSSSPSTSIAGAQPSWHSRPGSPTTDGASSGRASSGATRVR